MIPGQTWEILWQFPFVLPALLLNETIRHDLFQPMAICHLLNSPQGWLVCGHSRTHQQRDALPSFSRESTMERLHNASKKSDFSSLSITLCLSWDKEGRRKTFHVSPGRVNSQIFRHWLSKEHQNFAPSVTVSSAHLPWTPDFWAFRAGET